MLTFCGTFNIILLWHKKRGDEMSPRTGRPKSDNPKSIEVKARIDDKMNEKLTRYCEKHQMSRTDVVRKGLEIVLENE